MKSADSSLCVKFDPPPRAILGCIQINSDIVFDIEGPVMISKIPGVLLRMQKIILDSDLISADTFIRNSDKITIAVKAIIPSTIIGLGCTSMSFILGSEKVDLEIQKADIHIKITDMVRSQLCALKSLKIVKLALLTPYTEDLSLINKRLIEENSNIKIVSHKSMNVNKDYLVSLISQDSIIEWSKKVNCEEAEAVLIGCSALRCCIPGFIDKLENIFKKPVITSTQCFLWNMLRSSGINDQITGYGKLLKDY